MLKNISVILACIVLWSCTTVPVTETNKGKIPVPGKLEVSKGNIHAQGTIATAERGGALIRTMQIDLSTTPPEFLDDVWVIAWIVGKTTLAKITPQLLKEHGYAEQTLDTPHNGITIRYRGGGFTFDFDCNGKLICLEANTESNDETSKENPRMGTYSSTFSLALPCSIPQFRSVFGKPDNILFTKVN